MPHIIILFIMATFPTLSDRLNATGESFDDMFQRDFDFVWSIQSENIWPEALWTPDNIQKALKTALIQNISPLLSLVSHEANKPRATANFYQFMRLYPLAFTHKPFVPYSGMVFIQICKNFFKSRLSALGHHINQESTCRIADYDSKKIPFDPFNGLDSPYYDYRIEPFSGFGISEQIEMIYHTLHNPSAQHSAGPMISLAFLSGTERLTSQVLAYIQENPDHEFKHATFIKKHPLVTFLSAGIAKNLIGLTTLKPFVDELDKTDIGDIPEDILAYFSLHLKKDSSDTFAAEFFFFLFHGNEASTEAAIDWMKDFGVRSLHSNGYLILGSNIAQTLEYTSRKRVKPEPVTLDLFISKTFGTAPDIALHSIHAFTNGRIETLIRHFSDEMPAPTQEDLMYLIPLFLFPPALDAILRKFPEIPHRRVNSTQLSIAWTMGCDRSATPKQVKAITIAELFILHFRLIFLPSSGSEPSFKLDSPQYEALKEICMESFGVMVDCIGDTIHLCQADLMISTILEMLENDLILHEDATAFLLKIGLPVLLSTPENLDYLIAYKTGETGSAQNIVIPISLGLKMIGLIFDPLDNAEKMRVSLHWYSLYSHNQEILYFLLAQGHITKHPELLSKTEFLSLAFSTFQKIAQRYCATLTPSNIHYLLKNSSGQKKMTMWKYLTIKEQYDDETLNTLTKKELIHLINTETQEFHSKNPLIQTKVNAQFMDHTVRTFISTQKWLIVKSPKKKQQTLPSKIKIVAGKHCYQLYYLKTVIKSTPTGITPLSRPLADAAIVTGEIETKIDAASTDSSEEEKSLPSIVDTLSIRALDSDHHKQENLAREQDSPTPPAKTIFFKPHSPAFIPIERPNPPKSLAPWRPPLPTKPPAQRVEELYDFYNMQKPQHENLDRYYAKGLGIHWQFLATWHQSKIHFPGDPPRSITP